MNSDAEQFFTEIEQQRDQARARAKVEQVRIGERVRAARGSVSQAYVVHALDKQHGLLTSTRALSQIESGKRALKLSEAVALAEVFGVDLTAFTQDHLTRTAEGVVRVQIDELQRVAAWVDTRIENLRDEIGE